MKLNVDLIRKILVVVEENTDFTTYYKYEPDNVDKRLKKYTHDEIIYHLYQCDLSGLIEAEIPDSGDFAMVSDLTPKGHEFLANIRQDNIWNTIKSIGTKLGATSLSAFIQISSNVVSEIIKAYLGANGLLPIP